MPKNLTPQDVNKITDFAKLLGFLQDKLEWPVDPSKMIEEVTFDYTADELRVQESAAVRLRGGIVRQLRDVHPDQKLGIFFVEFDDAHVYATALRQILRGLVPNRRQSGQHRTWTHENLLFICATANYEQFTFAHFSGDKAQTAKLSTFGWQRGDVRMRTLLEHNLPPLRWPEDNGKDGGAWIAAWSKAFDKERLTKDFFRRFDSALAAIKDDLQKNNKFPSPEAYTKSQLLLERLIFLYFLQNRGWLSQQRDYLVRNFKAHRQAPNRFTYYEIFLEKLFWTLASPPGSEKRLPSVPFLNGGLFDDDEFTPGRGERSPALKIRNSTFALVFDELLEAFNFTVREDTPLSQEVAVDPEMLGKVFESIILHAEAADPDANAPDKRKATGSYYTPRIVVHFICKEVLRQYLISRLPHEPFTKTLRNLIEIDASDGLHAEETDRLKQLLSPSDAVKILPHLFKPRCCDPAVGSGAFPVGLLHELLNLRRLVEAAAGGYVDPVRKEGTKWLQRVKQEIIQDCLYGVDIQQQAIEICQLRLWLSLVVDYDLGIDPFTADPTQFRRAIDSVEPLPNLEMNFRRGDSLHDYISGVPIIIHPHFANVYRADFDFIRERGRKLHDAQRGAEKLRLRIEILRKRLEISSKVLEAELRDWRREHSMLTDTLFANETPSKAVKRNRIEEEVCRVEKALKRLAVDRDKLESLAKSPMNATYYQDLRELEGADFDSPINFAWHIDFADIFAPKPVAALATITGEFAFINEVKGQSSFVEERTEPSGFDIIVGNPPFVTARNAEKRTLYRERWPRVCEGNYLLLSPFFELSFDLLTSYSQLGFIVSNAFAKRDVGKPLVEKLFPTVNIQKVIDCSGLLFPGHGTPTCLVFARKPLRSEATRAGQLIRVAAILPGGGDLRTPPEDSVLWRTIAEKHDSPGFNNGQVVVADRPREEMIKHPWNFDASGEVTKRLLESKCENHLSDFTDKNIGRDSSSQADDVYYAPLHLQRRAGIEQKYLKPLVVGEQIRDWEIDRSSYALWPYEGNAKPRLSSEVGMILGPFKKLLAKRSLFNKTTIEAGLEWFEYREYYVRGLRPQIVFPYVATHGHFVISTEPSVFNRHGLLFTHRGKFNPATNAVFLGVLNSSTAVFWLKQYCFNKGAGAEEERDRFEFTGGRVEQFPIPASIAKAAEGTRDSASETLLTLSQACSQRGQELSSLSVKKVFEKRGEAYHDWNATLPSYVKPPTEVQPAFTSAESLWDRFACAIARRDQLRAEMIARQEEMDWLVYLDYGFLSAGDPSARVEEEPAPLDQAQRPFRLWDAAAGNFASAVKLIPADWSTKRRELWQARLGAIRDNEHIRRIEQPVYKRRWDEQWKVGNRWQSGQPAYDAEFIEAFDWWLSEKAEWWLEKKKAGGPIALDDWTAALLKDSRVAAAWPVIAEAIHRLELWKLQQKSAGKPLKHTPVQDPSPAAFASYFKTLVREQTVPEGTPFAVSYDKIKPPVSKQVQIIRGKLNVPRERFQVTNHGNYRVAKPF